MQTRTLFDALGRRVTFPFTPQKIISLCPSQTETIEYLAPGRLAGVTRFCVHPESIAKVPRVGGTKKVNVERIKALQPDIIIGEKEENTPEMVSELEKEFPVYITNVENIESAYQMLFSLGEILGTEKAAQTLTTEIKGLFDAIPLASPPFRCAYFIWRKPYMVAGRDTYINAILNRLGFENVFSDKTARYPAIETNELQAAAPQCIFLSSEPYPFCVSHLTEIQKIAPLANVYLVDGEFFSWYGARMREAAPYLSALQGRLSLEIKK